MIGNGIDGYDKPNDSIFGLLLDGGRGLLFGSLRDAGFLFGDGGPGPAGTAGVNDGAGGNGGDGGAGRAGAQPPTVNDRAGTGS